MDGRGAWPYIVSVVSEQMINYRFANIDTARESVIHLKFNHVLMDGKYYGVAVVDLC